MMYFLLFFVASAFASSHINAPIVPIIDGTDASLKDYPWQVSLTYAEVPGYHYCGGVIVAKRKILTAAHCIDPEHPAEVFGGGDGSRSKLKQLPAIKNIIIHPDYVDATMETTGNDIAILELAADIPFSETIQPVSLPKIGDQSEKQLAQAGQDLAISGWGYDRSLRTTQQLKAVHGLNVSNTITSEELFLKMKVMNHQTSCLGDSGGPLVRLDTKTLIGLSSFGAPDCTKREYFYYTNLYRYLPWIEQNIR